VVGAEQQSTCEQLARMRSRDTADALNKAAIATAAVLGVAAGVTIAVWYVARDPFLPEREFYFGWLALGPLVATVVAGGVAALLRQRGEALRRAAIFSGSIALLVSPVIVILWILPESS
jgi:cytochrome bd-type quinol oxidase subunit 2